jgi:hypothetical protein
VLLSLSDTAERDPSPSTSVPVSDLHPCALRIPIFWACDWRIKATSCLAMALCGRGLGPNPVIRGKTPVRYGRIRSRSYDEFGESGLGLLAKTFLSLDLVRRTFAILRLLSPKQNTIPILLGTHVFLLITKLQDCKSSLRSL